MKKTIFDEEQKEEHLKIVISLLAFIAAVAAEQIFRLETVFAGRFGWVFPFVIFFAIYLICGAEIIAGALKGIFKEHEFLGEEFLMMIASLGAFALGIYNGISEYRSGLLPQDKVAELEKYMEEKGPKDVICYIGDGINDAPSLIRADVGVALLAVLNALRGALFKPEA